MNLRFDKQIDKMTPVDNMISLLHIGFFVGFEIRIYNTSSFWLYLKNVYHSGYTELKCINAFHVSGQNRCWWNEIPATGAESIKSKA
jgi:hypothetical protein